MLPAVMSLDVPCRFKMTPATRYTRAGVIEKNVPTTAKNERPIIV